MWGLRVVFCSLGRAPGGFGEVPGIVQGDKPDMSILLSVSRNGRFDGQSDGAILK